MICTQLLVCREIVEVVEICIVNARLPIFNNFLVIWDKLALDESDIEHRLTFFLSVLTQHRQNTDYRKLRQRSFLSKHEFKF